MKWAQDLLPSTDTVISMRFLYRSPGTQHVLNTHRLLCPWDSPGKSAGVGCHFLLQRIFLTQRLNPFLLRLLHRQACSLPLVPLGKPLPSHSAQITLIISTHLLFSPYANLLLQFTSNLVPSNQATSLSVNAHGDRFKTTFTQKCVNLQFGLTYPSWLAGSLKLSSCIMDGFLQ